MTLPAAFDTSRLSGGAITAGWIIGTVVARLERHHSRGSLVTRPWREVDSNPRSLSHDSREEKGRGLIRVVAKHAVPFHGGTVGSNLVPSSGESGEIHERACGAEVQPHPVHRKPAMKLRVIFPPFPGAPRDDIL